MHTVSAAWEQQVEETRREVMQAEVSQRSSRTCGVRADDQMESLETDFVQEKALFQTAHHSLSQANHLESNLKDFEDFDPGHCIIEVLAATSLPRVANPAPH